MIVLEMQSVSAAKATMATHNTPGVLSGYKIGYTSLLVRTLKLASRL